MPGKTVTVSNAAQLLTAARAAKSGDTILLASGNYGDVSLSNINPAGTITIKSANPDNDAVFRTLNTSRISNIVFDDIDIYRPLDPGANQKTFIANIGGNNLTFVGIDVSGSLNGSALDDGHGMLFSGTHISVLNSTFQQLNTAVAARGEDFLFAGNTVTEVREGVGITAMTRGVFENNYMANWQPNYAAGEHPDMFQVHSGGNGTASSELIFRNNIMLPGDNPVGGIMIGMQGVGVTAKHDNILIENNYYEGAYRHAISVSNTEDVTVRNNTVLMGDNHGLVPAIMFADVHGGLVEKNVSTLILEHRTLKDTDMVFSNNIDVWDSKFKKGILVSELFASGSDDNLDFSNLNVISTSAAGRAGAGFSAVADIGHLSGSSTAQMAAWLPGYDQHFTVFA
ncbi:MAG: right-handed parallel beta-helix repeat-containing protein [Sandarakinorhabdus sp.]|nr:right-handed parallel beta-helix repeat-containing protein [Sandarakinorhabdus sp.]